MNLDIPQLINHTLRNANDEIRRADQRIATLEAQIAELVSIREAAEAEKTRCEAFSAHYYANPFDVTVGPSVAPTKAPRGKKAAPEA